MNQTSPFSKYVVLLNLEFICGFFFEAKLNTFEVHTVCCDSGKFQQGTKTLVVQRIPFTQFRFSVGLCKNVKCVENKTSIQFISYITYIFIHIMRLKYTIFPINFLLIVRILNVHIKIITEKDSFISC